MKTNETKHNTELRAAVKHLYQKKAITKDSDIATKTKYKSNTVSQYLSGSRKASKPFILKFEQVFKLSLADFTDKIDENKEAAILLKLEALANVNKSFLIDMVAKVTKVPKASVKAEYEASYKAEIKRLQSAK
jgi:hypothetical protein